MLSSIYRTRPASGIRNETSVVAGNVLGTKIQREEIVPFSAAKPTKHEEMFYDDLRRTLALLELEDKGEANEDNSIVVLSKMVQPSGLVSSSPPSLASSLCSLSVGAREEDEDFTLSERAVKVAFSTVKVRQYTITIGDHPCCTTGYPLSLDWEYETMPEQPLEVFEASHGQKRNRQELLTSYEERRSRLDDCCTDDAKRLNRRLERQKCRNRRASDIFFS